MIHQTTLPIRTFHTDAFGHVNNSRYLELLEEARWQYAQDIGLTPMIRSQGLGFIIIDLKLRFRKPVLEGNVIVVETCLESLGTASGDVKQTVFVAEDPSQIQVQGNRVDRRSLGSPALKGMFHFVLIDRDTARSVPIAGEIRDCLDGVLLAS